LDELLYGVGGVGGVLCSEVVVQVYLCLEACVEAHFLGFFKGELVGFFDVGGVDCGVHHLKSESTVRGCGKQVDSIAASSRSNYCNRVCNVHVLNEVGDATQTQKGHSHPGAVGVTEKNNVANAKGVEIECLHSGEPFSKGGIVVCRLMEVYISPSLHNYSSTLL
jgi:hypothetical protein